MVASFVLRTWDSVELIERRAYEGRQADRLKNDKTRQDSPLRGSDLFRVFRGVSPPSFKGFSVTVFLFVFSCYRKRRRGWLAVFVDGGGGLSLSGVESLKSMKGPMSSSAEHMTGCGYLLGVSRL